MQFTYVPLPTSTSIRLLQIHAADQGSISATLLTTELESAPSYDALSYTWGSPLSPYISGESGRGATAQHTIIVKCGGESQQLCIAENLKDALIALHTINLASISTARCAYLWVDAICINQTDRKEKAVQVRFMERIYQHASKVLAWLGPEDETTSHVFQVIDNLSKLGPEYYKSVTPEDVWRPQIHVEKLNIQALNYRHWLSWVAFLHRPYFGRVWIVQENNLAKDIVLVCGNRAFTWSAMMSTMNFLVYTNWATLLYTELMVSSNVLPERSQLGIFAKLVESKVDSGQGAWNLFHGRNATILTEKQWSLFSLLERYRYCESSDPRDMIYALIGVARKDIRPFNTQPQLLEVSYDMSVGLLYGRTAKAMLLAWGDLSHLEQKEGAFMTKIKNLPSWVPDYSAQIMPESLLKRKPDCKWNASRDFKWLPDTRPLDDPLLDVQGKFIGSVEDMSMDPLIWTLERTTEFWCTTCTVACGLSMPYPSFHDSYVLISAIRSRIEILWRTLLADVFNGTLPAPHNAAKHFFEDLCMVILKEFQLQRRARDSSLGNATNDFDSDPNIAPWYMLVDAEPEDSAHAEEFMRSMSRIADIAARDTSFTGSEGYVGLEGMLEWRRENNIAFGRRRLFRTSTELLGLGPMDMVIGDEVWILAGAKMPFVLRSLENGRYRLLGQAYVHGVMHGEAVEGSDGSEFENLTLE